MIVSRNEVEQACHRAALGAGLPHGHAEEAAAAGGFLAAHRGDAVALLAAAYRTLAGGHRDPPPFTRAGRAWRCDGPTPLAALAIAPAVADVLAAGLAGEIVLKGVDQPLVLAAHLAARGNLSAAIHSGDWPVAAIGPLSWRLPGDWTLAQRPLDVTAVPAPAPPPAFRAAPPPIEARAEDWAVLLALMRLSYVPASSRSSASGAGAGRIDND